MQKKRRALRAPFIVTVAAAASVAGAVALPGCDITVVQGGGCPEQMPERESSCDAVDLSCAYVDGCDNPIGYTCVDGAWQVESEVSCNPPPPEEECPGPVCNPPPPPPACPDEMPKRGSRCNAVDLACAYVDGCDNPIGTRCVDGAWQVESEVSCNPPPPEEDCPSWMPDTGTACSQIGMDCVYGDPGDCLEPPIMTCGDDGTWVMTRDEYCNPPPPQPEECLAAATSGDCAGLSPACAWLVPGCADDPGPPALPAAGCYPRVTCEDDAACPDGTRCQEVVVDPCGASSSSDVGGCGACGMTRNVCVPPSAATGAP
ncbi:hypothetical protein [Sorangium sp. So ce1335]|uniref:hypothetical protein n=1 Tax=Sorangium sp. So ce1335 TaxID=3133335 RepID=UPI003F5E7763